MEAGNAMYVLNNKKQSNYSFTKLQRYLQKIKSEFRKKTYVRT